MRPAGWALASAALGPVALVGGWLVAAALQPPGYDPVAETISALARHGAAHRWVMTAGLAVLGTAHLVTAAGLRGLPAAARAVLAAGGLATLVVAAVAQPATGSSAVHVAAATAGFVLLAGWPATTATRAPGAVPVRRPRVAFAVAGLSLALSCWVALAGGLVGVAERLATAQQALWPLVVVVALRRAPAARRATATIGA